MKISLGKKEIIHFIGIGGIGMSGLALIMKDLGFNVKGSDQQDGKNIDRLKKNKINIQVGHKRKNLSNAIDSLPEKQKEIIQLSYINDMTQEEISKYLSIPVGTVKSRMRLAYQKMKDNLGELII